MLDSQTWILTKHSIHKGTNFTARGMGVGPSSTGYIIYHPIKKQLVSGTLEKPSKGPAEKPAWRKHCERMGYHFSGKYALNKRSLFPPCSKHLFWYYVPSGNYILFQNQELEVGVVPHTITPCDLPAGLNFCPSISGLCRLEALIHKGGTPFFQGHRKHPIELTLQPPLRHLAFLVHRDYQAVRGIII